MPTLKETIVSTLTFVRDAYAKDLAALSHSALDASPGGTARAPYDVTYEVAAVNNRMATILRGENPGAWPFESWAVAPAEFRDPERAVAELNASVNAVIDAIGKIDDSDLLTERTLPSGRTDTPFGLAHFSAMHTTYHDAQLNYVQELSGDMAMHWG